MLPEHTGAFAAMTQPFASRADDPLPHGAGIRQDPGSAAPMDDLAPSLSFHREPDRGEYVALIARLYEAVLDPALWPSAVTRLVRTLRGTGGSLHVWDPSTRSVHPIAMPDWSHALSIGARLTDLPDRDPYESFANSAIVHEFQTGREFFAHSESAGAEIWTNSGRPHLNHQHVMGASVPVSNDAYLNVAVHRTPEMLPFDEVDRRIFASMLRHVQNAAIQASILTTTRIMAALQPARSTVPTGIIILDSDRRVLHANEAAEDLLRSSGLRLLRSNDGLLRQEIGGRMPGEATPLNRLVSQVLKNGRGTDLRLDRTDQLPPLIATVMAPPLGVISPFDPFFRMHRVVIVLRPLQRVEPPPVDRVRVMFGLTAAEANVAIAVYGGANAAAIATERGVTESTIRAQIRAILEKTHSAHLRDLVRLMAGLL